MMKRSLLFTFWLQVAAALLVVGQFFVPSIRDFIGGGSVFLIPLIIFSLVGGILIFLTKRSKIKGRIQCFLMLTGISSASFFVGVFLHNLFYALATITSHLAFLSFLLRAFEVGFFLLAVIVCPIAFCIGMIGSIVLLIKNREKKSVKDES
jgi:hypothetical protein